MISGARKRWQSVNTIILHPQNKDLKVCRLRYISLKTWPEPNRDEENYPPLGSHTGSRDHIPQGRGDKVLPPLTTYFWRVDPSTPLDSISQDGERASAPGFISSSSERETGKNGEGGEEEKCITAFRP